jgi:outer membrane usher protein
VQRFRHATRGCGRAPSILSRVSLSASREFGSLSASCVDYQPFEGKRSRLLTASFSRELFAGGYFDASAFFDLDRHRGSGVLAGFSFPIGGKKRSSTRVTSGPDGIGAITRAKPVRPVPPV